MKKFLSAAEQAAESEDLMEFFNSAVDTLQTIVVGLGGALCVWGGINLLEGYGQDNPGKVKNAFDLDRLIDRRRRPGMNEECEVYEVSVPDEALTDEDEDILNYDDLDDPDAFV